MKVGDRRNAYAYLEILNHHLTQGTVWDGDQISKDLRGDLVKAGMLWRVDGTGYHALTKKGAAFILRYRPLFLAWRAVKHLPGQWVRDGLRSMAREYAIRRLEAV